MKIHSCASLAAPSRALVLVALAGAVVLCNGCRMFGGKPPVMAALTEEDRALAARAEAAIELAAETPGREYANRLRTDIFPVWLQRMKEEEAVPAGEFKWIRKQIVSATEMAEAGPDWPRPPRAVVPKAIAKIAVDGKLDDPAWQHALAYSGMFAFNKVEKVEAPATDWKILWDDHFLYFAFDCVDTDLTAPIRERDDAVYSDDCVEMFILPDPRFRTYWELIIAPGGSIFDSVQCKRLTTWGLDGDTAQNIEGLQIGIDIRGTLNQAGDIDGGYTVEVAVPFAELPGYSRARPAVGQTLHFMLVRLDRDQGKFHVYAYQPLQAWGHNIWNHAVMELGK